MAKFRLLIIYEIKTGSRWSRLKKTVIVPHDKTQLVANLTVDHQKN